MTWSACLAVGRHRLSAGRAVESGGLCLSPALRLGCPRQLIHGRGARGTGVCGGAGSWWLREALAPAAPGVSGEGKGGVSWGHVADLTRRSLTRLAEVVVTDRIVRHSLRARRRWLIGWVIFVRHIYLPFAKNCARVRLTLFLMDGDLPSVDRTSLIQE